MANFRGISSSMLTNTSVNVRRRVAEDAIYSVSTSTHAEEEVDNEHAEIEFDKSKLPSDGTNKTIKINLSTCILENMRRSYPRSDTSARMP